VRDRELFSVLASFVKEALTAYAFGTFVENQMAIPMWVYF
jgi:hypothetical protein